MEEKVLIAHPPRTIMEVFKMLPEGTLAEVIENTLYMSPTPVSNHQRIITKLLTQLCLHIESHKLGEVFTAPFDVYLDTTSNAVQPDLLFIAKDNARIVEENGYVHGVPDLIIEVLSPGNRKHDLVIKKNLYEKFGVKEYWIVDPMDKSVFGFEFVNNTFQELPSVSGVIKSNLLNNIFLF